MLSAIRALLLGLLLLGALPAAAQTETPTPTNTPGPTATATPDIYFVFTLPPAATYTGTPGVYMPGQAVAIRYEMSVDGIAISIVLFAIFVVLLIIVVLLLTRNTAVK